MPKFIDEVKLFTDGGCRGNPGPGAIGVIILDGDNTELHAHAECIGNTTNNRAEYHALIKGLRLCAKHTRGRVTCYLDSELVVRQMNGVYRLKKEELLALFQKVKVAAVRTSHVRGKVKRMGRYQGRRPNWKKAWVRLAEGSAEIEFLETK